MFSRAGLDAIMLMILKLNEIIESLFRKKRKSVSIELIELDHLLKKNYGFSIIAVSENTIVDLEKKLELVDLYVLDKIIFSFYNVIYSEKDDLIIQKLKSNINLKERIMELILFTESKSNHFSLERNNIKNSLQHN
ncbi:hypothetical protein [Flavobacterium lacus]|uniref:Uncharacterized protein n=1 Tax=Flavobacterium lacus TaxID=1353778 RepID=A0A328WX87_9FLAO|nr:hypothetical protein [Flavobacterium lacus]RAR48484.1 hypothetical protein B0I10_10592 [Flavobacterium lacus]